MPERVERSLPAWLYTDAGFESERRHLFARTPHLICHVNDIPDPGDYQTLDILGEKFFALRGADGQVRSFHNVCRHRASRLADGTHGNCGHRLVCPYHAWSYTLDGRSNPCRPGRASRISTREIRTCAARTGDLARLHLRPHGPGAPSVAEMMAPYDDRSRSMISRTLCHRAA